MRGERKQGGKGNEDEVGQRKTHLEAFTVLPVSLSGERERERGVGLVESLI